MMNRPCRTIAFLVPALALGLLARGARGLRAAEPAKPAGPVSFFKQVKPILQQKCQGCHQPAKAGGKLILTSYDNLKAGGENEAAFVPGKPDDSVLMEYISGPKPRMPKDQPPLSAAEVETIRRWIAEGAKDDTPASGKDPIDIQHPPVYAAPPLISALAYSPDGRLLAVSGFREILLHNADGSGLVARLVGLSQRIESLKFTPDGKVLIAVGGSPGRFGEVQFWDVARKRLKNSIMVGYDTLYGGSLAPDAKHLAFGCGDNSARVVEIPSGKQTLRIDHHSDWVFGTAFSRDGSHLVTCSRDQALKLTVVATGQFVDNITSITPGALTGTLWALVRQPKTDNFLTGGEDGVPRLYKMVRTKKREIGDNDQLIRAYGKLPGPITGLAFSPDGALLVAGCGSGEARVFQTADGKLVATLQGGNVGALYSVAFHPNGQQVATGGFDGQVRIYDVKTGKLLHKFTPVAVLNVASTAR